MPVHIVKQGETLSSIARRHGFKLWRPIYDRPENEALRRKRPDPDMLFPGDELFVPSKEPKRVEVATTQEHVFVVAVTEQVLRLAIEDDEGRRLKDAAYELKVDGDPWPSGKTDGTGILSVAIPVDARSATLTVGSLVWTLAVGHLNPLDEETPDGGVSGAQARLDNLGFSPGPPDGVAGPRTRAALRRFQAAERLTVTGELDADTRQRLLARHGC